MTYRTPTVVSGTAGTATADISITKPSAVRIGDLLILVVAAESEVDTITVDDDWKPIIDEIEQGEVIFRAWYKFADNTEPTSYSVTFNPSGVVIYNALYNLFIVRGADPFVVVDAYDSANGNGVLPVAEPGITTTVNNCLAVACLAFEGSPRGLVVPSGWTELESRDGAAGTISQAIAYKEIAAAGGSGGANWTATDSSAGDYAAVTFAIRPGPMSLENSVLYEPQQLLAKTLADCTEFRNLVGADSHSEALASIWHESLPRPANGGDKYTLTEMQSYRPFALIFTEDVDGALGSRKASSPGAWSGRGTLRILLEMDTPDSLAASPALLDQMVKQIIGRIDKRPDDEATSFSGLRDLAQRTNEVGGYSYLAIDEVAFRGYSRSHARDQQSQGDYVFAWIEVMWGRA